MNYRHQFHAGNIADVFKHIVLTFALEKLRAKDTPLCVIDTHAGGGLYRLRGPGEYQQGIGRLWPVRADWPGLTPYFDRLLPYNRRGLSAYPGSPLLIQGLLRAQDRAVFVERQPQEAAALRDNLRGAGMHECRERRTHRSGRGARGIAVHEADGFAMLKALVPPGENRGLVLIDPPYEKPDEFEQVAAALRDAHRRWRNGVYMVWYPIKARAPVTRLLAAAGALGAEGWAVEFLTLPEDVPQRLNGSGVLFLNPPWQLDAALRAELAPLAAFLAGPDGRPQLRFLGLQAAGNLRGA